MGSSDDDDIGGVDAEASTGEIYGGVRKSFGEDVVRPYVGAGLSFINAEAELGGVDDDDSSGAVYVHGGIAFAVSESFFLGIDLRFLMGSDIDIFGSDADADYGQLAFMMGFGF
jgi:hypothetical protein